MARAKQKVRISYRRSLVTPEGVDLGVTLADAGARAAAFFLDAVFIMAAGLCITLVALFGFGGLDGDATEPISVVWILLIFFLRNAYFLAFEAGRGARTPGKRIMGLRVASRDGTALGIDQIIARNLMREIEVFLPLSMLFFQVSQGGADTVAAVLGLAWALIFAFFPLFNRDRLRIGDLLAGTWVVELPKRLMAVDLAQGRDAGAPGLQFTPAQLDAYGIAELHKLEEVLRGGNEAALATVAKAIGEKIGVPAGQLDSRNFLRAYYSELRAHLERKLLLGTRRASKHDA